jgi:hypothetical protein
MEYSITVGGADRPSMMIDHSVPSLFYLIIMCIHGAFNGDSFESPGSSSRRKSPPKDYTILTVVQNYADSPFVRE